jgi:hypothetical protein
MELVGKSKLPDFRIWLAYDRTYNDAELKKREKEGRDIPRRTVFQRDDADRILDHLGRNPNSFEGVIFGDRDAELQFCFDNKRMKCVCGTKLQFFRKEINKNGEIEEHFTDTTYCPNPKCNKKWIYIHEPAESQLSDSTAKHEDDNDDDGSGATVE